MSNTTPPAVSDAMRERIEDILRDDPCGQKPSWENANRIVDEVVATALAEARAEGRRQGLEEAATHLENRADYFNRSPGYRQWDDAARSYRASASEVRKLGATAPPETQKPETGESAP